MIICLQHNVRPGDQVKNNSSFAGFFPSAGYFFTFYLICIASMILMSAVYRLLAAASPNMDIASATGATQSKPRLLLALIMACACSLSRFLSSDARQGPQHGPATLCCLSSRHERGCVCTAQAVWCCCS